MQYTYHKPDLQLQQYIQTVLLISAGSVKRPSDLPLFTNGMPALLYEMKIAGPTEAKSTASNQPIDIESHKITIFGQSIPHENFDLINESNLLIAFLFRPFALGPLLKLPAAKLKGQPIKLELWNAQKAMAVQLQLIHSTTPEEKLQILNHFLVTQLERNRRDCELIQTATDEMMEHSEKEVLAKLVNKLNVTERTFQRIFKQYTGISANQYRRICQFYFAFSQLKGKHFEKQTDVAYDNNYFDQSHYIRSFKEFTDLTPNDYLQFGLGNRTDDSSAEND